MNLLEKNGIGSVMCELIEGKGDLTFNFAPDYTMWDTCGPAALLMSRLGYCADSRGHPLRFEARRNQFYLWNGFIAARHIKDFRVIEKQWKQQNESSFA